MEDKKHSHLDQVREDIRELQNPHESHVVDTHPDGWPGPFKKQVAIEHSKAVMPVQPLVPPHETPHETPTVPNVQTINVSPEELACVIRAVQQGSASDQRGNYCKSTGDGVECSFNREHTDGHGHFYVNLPDIFSLVIYKPVKD